MKDALINGDSLDILKKFPDNSFDSMITDPPAGIAFMGKKWDKDKGGRKLWIAWLESIMTEAFRTLKPGAHILVWAIPRTSHWTATAIENAEFEIRDVVTHIFGSGFPKSLNIGKDIDRVQGNKREVVGKVSTAIGTALPSKEGPGPGGNKPATKNRFSGNVLGNAISDEAKQWEGWGTALKPASEHWILARKPLSEKTIATNVLEHGTGGINIDASRIVFKSEADKSEAKPQGRITSHSSTAIGAQPDVGQSTGRQEFKSEQSAQGRFPANLVLSHKPGCKPKGCDDSCVIKMLDDQSGERKTTWVSSTHANNRSGEFLGKVGHPGEQGYNDTGGASRFFKQVEWDCEDDCAVKQLDEQSLSGGMHSAGKKRESGSSKQAGEGGLLGVGNHEGNGVRFGDNGGASRFFYCAKASKKEKTLNKTIENKHPTVKSLKLMKYLINLVTPPGGVVLDPFMGSGTTGQAALEGKFGFVGIELEADSFEICKNRCSIDNIIISPKLDLDE